MSKKKKRPSEAADMSNFWRLVSVVVGRVSGTWWVVRGEPVCVTSVALRIDGEPVDKAYASGWVYKDDHIEAFRARVPKSSLVDDVQDSIVVAARTANWPPVPEAVERALSVDLPKKEKNK